MKYDTAFGNSAGALAFSGSDRYTAGGYAAGGGVEYAYPSGLDVPGHHSAITFRVEYLHYDLGRKTVNDAAIGGVGTGSYASTFNTQGNLLRAGVNFKF